jgi:hypothetical protein
MTGDNYTGGSVPHLDRPLFQLLEQEGRVNELVAQLAPLALQLTRTPEEQQEEDRLAEEVQNALSKLDEFEQALLQ